MGEFATVSINMGGGNLIATVLNPSFKGVPDAVSLAKYLLNALYVIKKHDLPIHIYIDHDLTPKIGPILQAMGVKFKTIPVEKMVPPYIFIDSEDGYVVIKSVDSSGKEVSSFRAPLTKFIEAFQEFYLKEKKAAKKEKAKKDVVDEAIVSLPDIEKFISEHKDIFEE